VEGRGVFSFSKAGVLVVSTSSYQGLDEIKAGHSYQVCEWTDMFFFCGFAYSFYPFPPNVEYKLHQP
jgi:hypothetical protein